MIGRIIGGVVGGAIGRQKSNHPVAGAMIGAATMFAARRVFPARYAALAATAAAGYLTKKWAERREAEARMAEALNPQGLHTPTAPIVASPPSHVTPATPASPPAGATAMAGATPAAAATPATSTPATSTDAPKI